MDIPGLEPPLWSRNWGDLDDELDLLEQDGADIAQVIAAKPTVTFVPSVRKSLKDGKYHAKLLVVGVHDAACTFLSSVWGSAGLQTIGSLLLPEVPLDNVGLSTPVEALKFGFPVTYLQSLPQDPSVVLVGCGQAVPPHRAFAWTNALFSSVQAERVIVLDTLLESSFVTLDGSRLPPPTLRRLSTAAIQKAEAERKDSSVVPSLEAPNLVHGLSAAVISHCEVRSLPAELFISIESPHSIGDTLAAFEAAFSSLQSTIPQSFKALSAAQKLSHFLSSWRTLEQARKLAGGRTRHVGNAQAAINAALGDLASSHGSSLERGRNAAPVDLFI